MITTLAAAGLMISACGSGDGSTADDSTTVVPESGNGTGEGEATEGAEGNQTSDDGSADEQSESGGPLADTTWTVVSGETASVSASPTAEAGANVEFSADGKVGGYTGCNSFGGTAEIGEGTITFSQIIATKRACMGAANDLETVVLSTLHGEATYELNNGTLTITNGDAKLVLQAGSPE